MMFLDTYEQVSAATQSGRKVVCRAGSIAECRDVARHIIRTTKDDWFYAQNKPQILRQGDGFLHMVIHEDEARGMEYHDSIGWIGEAVAARVRIPTANVKEASL
jgi:hypothetical protein